MKGFSTNIVNLISDNLRDRYQSSLQIIKELLQNADDAKNPTARHFKFGKHKGFPFAESGHPLLRGSALYFFNDGGFSKSDQKAIRSFAENSKAADENVIGKFGLGMKSIFHLCEAFFYVAHDGAIEYREGLNPWKQDEFDLHPDWDEIFQEDWKRIETIYDQLSSEGRQTGFMLWVPLRRKEHLTTPDQKKEKTGCIIDRFPGENPKPDLDNLEDPGFPTRLAAILPLLQNLEAISYCPSAPSISDDGFEIRIKSENRIDHRALASNSFGFVDIEPKKNSLIFTVSQKCSDNPIFESLKNQSTWPKSFCRNELGHPVEEAYKARPEGSVMLAHTAGTGRLNIQWGVFLPLEENSHVFRTWIEGGERDYEITLHGQFFMDAGRRGIHGFDQLHQNTDSLANTNLNESNLRKQWNTSLACEVTLRLFLLTLGSHVKAAKLPDQDCRDLTAAIRNANDIAQGRSFYDKFRTHICAENAWIRELSPDGNHNWRLSQKSCKLRPLHPPPQNNPLLPWKVLPGLTKFRPPYLFLDSDAPAMIDHRPAWEPEEIIGLLEFDSECIRKIFNNRSMLDYLYEFIVKSTLSFNYKSAFQSQLIRLIRFGFRMGEEKVFAENRARIKRLVSLVQDNRRLKISSLKSLPIHFFSVLWQIEVDVLLVPSELDPEDNSSSAQPDSQTVLLWLSAIHEWIQQPETNSPAIENASALDLAQMLLKALSIEDRKHLLNQNPNLCVITARDAKKRRDVAVSFGKLGRLRRKGMIFGYGLGQVEERMGFTPLITDVLPDEQILLLQAQLYKLLFEDDENLPRANDGRACLRTIGLTAMRLGNLEARQKLLEKINDPGMDANARRGLRYLLHASSEHFEDEQASLWISGHHQSESWEKLWRLITGIGEEGAWNVLDRRLADILPRNRWDVIGIREINPSQVIEELRSAENITIDPSLFTQADCEEILANIEDRDLWLNLPFHRTLEGQHVSVDQNTYLETAETVDPSIRELTCLIERSKCSQLAVRQRNWITPLDATAILKIALETTEPSDHWRSIMDALNIIESPSEAIISKIRNVPWLPKSYGSPVQPEDVIDLSAIEDDIERLLAEHGNIFACVRQLNGEIQNHPAFAWLRENCFAKGDKGFDQLSLLLAETLQYHVGEIEILDELDFRELLPLLSEIVELPGWALLHRIAETLDAWEKCHLVLLPALGGSIPSGKTVSVLSRITRISCGRDQVKKAFNLYLSLFARDKDHARTSLPGLCLLNRSQEWKPAEALCTGVKGVDPVSVLDPTQSRILEGIAVNTGTWEMRGEQHVNIGNFDFHSQAAVSIIEDYFRPWQGLVSSSLIGAVIGLLGGDPGMRHLAELNLRPHSFDWFLDRLQWEDPGQTPTGTLRWLAGLNPHQAIDQFRFVIETADPDGLVVHNLLGDRLRVRLSAQYETLIVGEIGGRGDKAILKLRRVEPAQMSGGELSSLLWKTAEYLLHHLYNQKNANLEAMWQELDRSDQLETEVACGLILEHIPFYLRQLKVTRRNPELAQAILHYETCHRRKVESEQDPANESQRTAELRKKVREARNDVANLLQHNSDVQKVVLDAVREKLRDYQYGPSSIAFELFQNADDAAVEQGFIDAHPLESIDIPDKARRFVVDRTDANLRFMHWGRPINSRGPSGFDGEGRGYHHDLENMLILSSSDKLEEGTITGKFGMGFKSVLLLCDRPKIISGRLQVEVIAGVLPRPWTESTGARSRERLINETSDVRRPGTLIELDNSTDNGLFNSFCELAGMLCVFAQAIRSIEIHENGQAQTHIWAPNQITENVELGSLKLDSSIWDQQTTALRFGRSGDSAGILLALGPSGFRTLPKTVPTIWVTAPTRELLDAGFAVNGSFELDVGRAQLARGTGRNKWAAKKVGSMLGKSLCRLFDVSSDDWGRFRRIVKVSADLSPYAFWDTLWGLFGDKLKERVGPAGDGPIDLVAEMLWRNSNIGMYRLITEKDALPTGLWGSHQVLTCSQTVRYSCYGLLGQEDVFLNITDWETLRTEIPPGSIVSQGRVGQALKKLAPEIQLTPIGIIDVFQKEFGTRGNISPAMASRCGKLINEKWLSEWRSKGGALHQESQKLAEFFTTLTFMGTDGAFHPCNDLLIGHGSLQKNRDEILRSKFAPPQRILSKEYDTDGVLFFLTCRKAFEAGAKELARWIIGLTNEEKRHDALCYILLGELGRQASIELRPLIADTWMEALKESGLLQPFSLNDQMVLLGLLGLHKECVQIEPVPLSAEAVLSAIYGWWSLNKDNLIQEYNNQVYPWGSVIIPEEIGLRRNLGSRKKWLTLFLLGALQSIGWTNLQQHRSFILKCEDEGWLDIFCDPEQRSGEWMKVLEGYLEDESEDVRFYQWMKQFVSIFQLSRWLPEYAEAFLAINHIPSRFDLTSVLKPRTNPAFQGGGPDAPPITRTLGIGAHFVIRELVRNGVVKNKEAERHCFMPSQMILRLFEELGCDGIGSNHYNRWGTSGTIYEFVRNILGDEKATFCSCFDIPFRFICTSPELQIQFFRYELPEENGIQDEEA